jgi:folate-binding protein YgfZ
MLLLPGADAGTGVDLHLPWHFGDPMREQRLAERSAGLVDRSNREVLTVTGPDRLAWLNTLTTQLLIDLADGATTEALILSPTGHVEHHFGVTELDGTTYLDTEPGRGAALLEYLERMKFWTKVEVAPSPLRQLSVVGPTPPDDLAVGRAATTGTGFTRRTAHQVDHFSTDPATTAAALLGAGVTPIGSWADDALRIPTRRPRIGVDTDNRTIPNELSWLEDAVHLHKGCYRGQETVARVANLGRPPRRLVVLNLDGSQDVLPSTGAELNTADGRVVGRVGTVAQHYEDGPIALALVRRNILTTGVPLLAGGVDARGDPVDLVTADTRPASSERGAFLNLRRP